MAAASHAAGLDGLLRLRLVSQRGVTVIVQQEATAPFKLFPPRTLPDGSLVILVSVLGPGIRSGDRCRIELVLESGAKGLLLFPSSAKLLTGADGLAATQECLIAVAQGAQLEYYPGLNIPFPQSRFRQTVDACLEREARFGCLEMWASGRVERREEMLFQEIHSSTRVRVDDRPAYADTLRLSPSCDDQAGPGLLEGYQYWASGYWNWDKAAVDQPDVLRDGLELVNGKPPHGSLYLRGLARDGASLRKEIRQLLSRQRRAWGLPFVDFARYTNLFS